MGDPILFVHASGLSGRQWRRWRAAFPDREILTPDLVGSGDNPPWDRPLADFAVEMDLELLEAVIEARRPAHLVGHSYGGVLALLLAGRRPEIRSVTVYEPPLVGILEPNALDAAMPPGFFSADHVGSAAWVERFVDWWNGPGFFRALPEPSRRELVRTGPIAAAEALALGRERIPLEALAASRASTCCLLGSRAPRVVERAAERLRGFARVERVEGAGHMAPLTEPERLAGLVREHVLRAEPPGLPVPE